ncbi:MAG: DUF423 domain-containing protein [Opitutales bacterium]
MKPRIILSIGSLFGLTGVILGAFGAHALEAALAARETTAVWETAVDYQMWHALTLLLLATLPAGLKPNFSAICFVLGIVLFSGSLYGLALGGPKWLGPVTPLGGLSFIVGWIGLLICGWRHRE